MVASAVAVWIEKVKDTLSRRETTNTIFRARKMAWLSKYCTMRCFKCTKPIVFKRLPIRPNPRSSTQRSVAAVLSGTTRTKKRREIKPRDVGPRLRTAD